MARTVRLSLFCCLAGVLLAGCMRYAPAIYSGAALDPSKGYFYGRFSAASGFNIGAVNMGVVVTSVDKKRELALRFETSDDVYAVAVDPGDYQVTHIVFTQGADNSKQGEKPFPEEIAARIIRIEAGKAYYLGDYEGASKSSIMVLFIANEWRLGKIENDFAGTSVKLDALLPQMKGMPKEDVFGDALAQAFTRKDVPSPDAASATIPVPVAPAR